MALEKILCHTCAHCSWRATRTKLYGWWDEVCVHPARAVDWPLVGEATVCVGYRSMLSNFDKALRFVFEEEGKYSNRPGDHGGATMFGITQETYDRWRRSQGLPLQPVSKMSRQEATEIYRAWYWEPAACELLPEALALCAFDAYINHRPDVAIMLMQRTLGLVADGVIGPVTRKAYSEAVDSAALIWKFVSKRLDLYCDIVFVDASQRTFLKGWVRRAHGLEKLIVA